MCMYTTVLLRGFWIHSVLDALLETRAPAHIHWHTVSINFMTGNGAVPRRQRAQDEHSSVVLNLFSSQPPNEAIPLRLKAWTGRTMNSDRKRFHFGLLEAKSQGNDQQLLKELLHPETQKDELCVVWWTVWISQFVTKNADNISNSSIFIIILANWVNVQHLCYSATSWLRLRSWASFSIQRNIAQSSFN